jgi:Domain of unknown function (DUF6950)
VIRVDNFPLVVVSFAEEVRGSAFVWGRTDCGSLLRRSQALLFGEDIFEGLANWKTKAGALRALSSGGGLDELLQGAGLLPHPVAFAQTGDVLVGHGDDGDGCPRTAVMAAGKALVTNECDGAHLIAKAAFGEATAWGVR